MASCDKTILNRLKRTEGQVRGIQTMIEDGQDCVDVITQLRAVRSSIDRVMGIIVAENLRNCLEEPTTDLQAQQARLEEAIQLVIKK